MKDRRRSNTKIIWLILLCFLAILSINSLVLFSKARTQQQLGNQESLQIFNKLQGQLVSGFPDFPVYPGARIVGSYKKIDGERIGYEATWVTDVAASEVAAWYFEEFTKYKGWTIHKLPKKFSSDELVFELLKNNQKSTLTIEKDEDDPATEINVEFPLN